MGKYTDEAQAQAWDCASNFVDEMVEQWKRNGDISDDLNNDYPHGDLYHHENHVDNSYDLTEAAAILDKLDEYEETDHGLWDGLEPREAISAQAAYTYGNAVYSMWTDIVKEINERLHSLTESFRDERELQMREQEERRVAALADSDEFDEEEIDYDQDEVIAHAGERLIRFIVHFGDGEVDCAKMGGEEKALYVACVSAVEIGDSTPLLAYADWLDEHDRLHEGKTLRGIVNSPLGGKT